MPRACFERWMWNTHNSLDTRLQEACGSLRDAVTRIEEKCKSGELYHVRVELAQLNLLVVEEERLFRSSRCN